MSMAPGRCLSHDNVIVRSGRRKPSPTMRQGSGSRALEGSVRYLDIGIDLGQAVMRILSTVTRQSNSRPQVVLRGLIICKRKE